MRRFKSLIALLIFFQLKLTVVHAQPPRPLNAAELQLALKKLTVLGSALYIAAHPDDENTALLAYLSRERLVRTAYLSVTRGDGGQNLIGSEKGPLMGVLRTQELLAARRVDRAEQFFTRAVDFGYSKSPEETMAIWGKEKVLGDMVWVIRTFRPDVIVTRFPTSGGGHGQHTASAILAEEAFHAAGDPSRFPEQLKYVRPWQPRRLLWNAWPRRWGPRPADLPVTLQVDVGTYNPLLGKSYTEIAAESRSMHKSQGFGSAARRGSTIEDFALVAGDPAEKNLFDGVDLSWSRVPGGRQVGETLEKAYRAFKPEQPSAVLPLLLEAYAGMDKLPQSYWVPVKRKELLDTIRSCAGLWLEAIAEDYSAAPGSVVKINLEAINRSRYRFVWKEIRLPNDSNGTALNQELAYNQPAERELSIRLPQDAEISQPYWLKRKPEKGTYEVDEPRLIGQPESPPPLTARFVLAADGQRLMFDVPVLYRWTDPVAGEQVRPFEIVPEVAVNLEEKVYVFPDTRAKEVHLKLLAGAPDVSGEVRLSLPPGWRATPEAIPFSLQNKYDETEVSFTLGPPTEPATGILTAVVETGRSTWSHSLVTIEYPHIPIQTLFPPAEARLVRVDLRKRGMRIGYLMGSGDDIPASLRQVGYDVALLSDEDLEDADLSGFDAVILGVRAFNTRPRLKTQQRRLLEYVRSGGTLIVQYNTNRRLVTDEIGPYPFRISNERVTVEEAPVTFLDPNHPLLNTPNKITQEDFQGWVQERGLYFADEWDERYQTVLASHDPGESPKEGGLLFARYGKGVFIYTGYAFFRQLPAGVPGAYRLFVNMISAGRMDD
jgi:LmbE family N-acetylglucosaminyl deacetylase